MTILTAPDGTGRLNVTVQVTDAAGVPDNIVQYFRIVALANATVEFGGNELTAPTGMLTLDDGTRRITFAVERIARRNAFSATFEVWDMCGAWQSFAGGGPGQP
jgi:hypothetical protein